MRCASGSAARRPTGSSATGCSDDPVTSPDIARVTSLSREAGSLLAEGVPLSPEAPQYLFTRLGEMRIQMLGDATEDARTRAKQIAERTGGRIGRIKSVRQGVFQITPRNSTEIGLRHERRIRGGQGHHRRHASPSL
jgi:hypothetical protein